MASSQTFTLNIKALFDASDVKAKVGDIQSSLSKLKLPDKLGADLNKSFTGVNKALDDFISRTEKGIKTKSDASGITKSFENVTKELNNLDNLMVKVKGQLGDGVDLSKIIKFDGSVKEQLETINKQITELQQKINSINTSKLKDLQNSLSQIKSKGALGQGNKALELFKQGDLEGSLQVLNAIISKLEALKAANETQGHNTSNITASLEALRAMQTTVQEAQRETTGLVEQQNAKIAEGAQVARQAAEDYASALNNDIDALHQVSNETSGLTSKINDLAAGQAQFVREVDQVKSRIQYFFGLTNAINLVKRAIRGAVDTIKDLDKAMTATAVVTDFTVSDMWSQLPEYTKRANELGVTTQAAYEAATLYYQQGLNNDEVNALSVETLKMARIAGLDAAEATDRMTNALRGFNMALDEQSAQRVDDVYSELAANTASNVDEISTAMTKVASLAHSANMEFETTAAFLAQIIETTRESAETAGTALKTVVARFSEVKKLVDTNQLKGQDEEGQVIDVNKVGAALRTAGIDLNKYFLGEVGLDDIFMELASKWDTLTSVQQRYIATQAAGSRQQSRFIALMQDYARTQELVGKAYNAEGASARQFEKTQESLESKLNRLKNAWNEFLMGLTNNVMVKTVVDLLTDLLNLVNKITSAFGDGVGSILKWVAALGTLGGLRRLFTDGGLATQLISNLMGKGLGANKLRVSMGRGFFDEAGQYSDYTKAQLKQNRGTTLIGGIGGIGKTLWGGAQKLGNKFATTGLGYKLGMSTTDIFTGGIGASALTETAAGITGIATALGAVAVAAGAAYGAYKLWLKYTPEGQLKTAKKLADTLEQDAQKAQDTASAYKNLQSTYADYTAKVDEASTATDYEVAIQSRNDAILKAIEENPNYAQFLQTDFSVDGQLVLTLDENRVTEAAVNAAAEATKASIESYFAQAEVFLKEAAITEQKQQDFTYQSGQFFGGQGAVTVKGDKSAATENLLQSQTRGAANYAQLAYAQMIKLADLGLSDELSSNLAKMLGNLFAETGKAIDQVALESIEQQLLDGKLDSKVISSAFAENFDFSLANINLDTVEGFNSFLTSLEITSDELDDFANELGVEAEDIRTILRRRAKEVKKMEVTARKGIYEAGLRNQQTITPQIESYLNSLNLEQLSVVQEVINSTADKIGEQAFSKLFASLPNLADEELQELQTFFNNFSLDSPLNALTKINNELDNLAKTNRLDSTFGQILTTIKNVNTELFSTSSLVQDFFMSDAYDQLSDSLADFIKDNGRISSKNIDELRKSSASLDNLLKNTAVSAKSLAEALTLLQKGTIPIEAITDALLKALDAGKSFEDMIDDVTSWVDDFDEGTDLNFGTDHIISELKTLGEYVDNWEFGNEPTENIYNHLFGKEGENSYQKLLKQYGNDFDGLEKYIEGRIKSLNSMAENEGLGGIQTALSKGLQGLTKISGKGGEFFNWDIKQFDSTTDAINAVAEALQLSQGAAEAMILSWQTHIPQLRTEWNELSYTTQLQTFAQAIQGQKAVTESELAALGASVGKTVEQVKADLESLKDKNGNPIEIPVIVNWQDSKGGNLSGDNLLQEFTNKFLNQPVEVGENITSDTGAIQDTATTAAQQYAEFLGDAFNSEANTIDFSSAMSKLLETGLSEAQASELLDTFAKTLNASLTDKVKIPSIDVDDNGNTIVSTIEQAVEGADVAALKANIDAEIEGANYELIATKIANVGLDALGANVAAAMTQGAVTGAGAIASVVAAMGPIPINYYWNQIGPSPSAGAQAAGGLVRSYASGSHSIKPGMALTGEEGPELVWNKDKGYAYITGQQHPQFQNLQPGDRVFNAPETRKILSSSSLAKGGLIDSYASGGWKPAADKKASGGGGGGGGSDKEKTPEEWKNELDWLYNLMEDIAELERDQKAIEEQYEDYLKDQSKTGKDLYNLLIKQLGNLYTQLNHQTFALEKREQEMREFMDTTNDKDEYLWYNWNDRTIEIDWDAIDKITDEEEYKHVKELVDEAESIQDKMDDAEDAIMDIQNQIQELENIWRDTFVDFEKRVYDAVVKSYQTVIDNYSELNDTLNNSNSQILDSLQKQISLQRQIRDNTKTEEEISDDEAKLAYLRRDTTGGNDLAALQLQKELDEQRQNYEDTLVDQAISRLQEDNDAAAQQRQQQIDIMQAQLDYQSENGEFNAYVRDLLTTAMGAEGELLTNSDLMTLLKEQDNWSAMSDVSQEIWEEELNGTFKEVAAFLLKQNAEQNGTFYTALTDAVKGVSTAIGSYSQAMTKLGNQVVSAASSGGGGGGNNNKNNNNNNTSNDTVPAPPKTNGIGTTSWQGSLKATAQAAEIASRGYGTIAEYTNQLRNKGYKYATGGLATSTGLAWLDGTPSEPEYVLNARQTDAFLKLAEVLPQMMNSSAGASTTTFGGTIINLAVNLDSVNPDYDVDRMVDLLKDKLYDSGSYRNVNSLSFLR